MKYSVRISHSAVGVRLLGGPYPLSDSDSGLEFSPGYL
jgi:hypothetical protein